MLMCSIGEEGGSGGSCVLRVDAHIVTRTLGFGVPLTCVCAHVCVRVRARVCVCVCVNTHTHVWVHMRGGYKATWLCMCSAAWCLYGGCVAPAWWLCYGVEACIGIRLATSLRMWLHNYMCVVLVCVCVCVCVNGAHTCVCVCVWWMGVCMATRLHM